MIRTCAFSTFFALGFSLCTSPAQAFIIHTILPPNSTGVTYTEYQQTFTDTLGRPLTGISLSSPDFPTTSFSVNGLSLVANFTGGTVLSSSRPRVFTTEIADPPGNTTVILSARSSYFDSDGNFHVGGEPGGVPGAATPFSYLLNFQNDGNNTYLYTSITYNTGSINSTGTNLQGPGSRLSITNNNSFSVPNVGIGAISIPSYQSDNSIFIPASQTFSSVLPGQTITVVVPEASNVLGLVTLLGIGVFLKLKRKASA